MNDELTFGQLSYSTADVESGQFSGEVYTGPVVVLHADAPDPLPSGDYRVIDGELFLIVDGGRDASIPSSDL